MNLELDNRVIVVSGGGRCIGALVVVALAGEGAVPIILDSEAPPPALVSRTGAPVHILNSAEPADCEAAVQRVVMRFGRIDGLVSGTLVAPDTQPKGAQAGMQALAQNLARHHLLIRCCEPHLRRSRGAIVSIASQAHHANDHMAVNAAILGLTQEWAKSFAGEVRINAVIPAGASAAAPVFSKGKSLSPPLKGAAARLACHTGNLGERHVADMVLFLLSARASRTTGQWMYVDGEPAG